MIPVKALLIMSDVSAHKIIDNVWVGNEASAMSEKFIRDNNIQVIINCTKDVPMKFSGITYFQIPIDDSLKEEDIDKMTRILPIVVEFIKRSVETKKNILVHCYQGAQRSAGVVTAYIMNKYNKTPREAVAIVLKRRPPAFHDGNHVNFDKSLVQYQSLLQTHNGKRVQNIPKIPKLL